MLVRRWITVSSLRPAPALAALTLFVGAAALPQMARAEGGSVLYSYEKVEVGSTVDWVLVPKADESIIGTPDASLVDKAFDKLKRDKRSTYGRSKIEISGKTAENAKVTVTIDPDKAAYAVIIIAETVYTLTELGVPEVHFPGYAAKGLKRHDVPFAAYTLTVPLWRALPPQGLTHTHVQLPDGRRVESSAIDAQWKAKDAQIVDAVYSYLQSDDAFTVTSVTRLLPKIGVYNAERLIPLLAHPSAEVRMAAVEVIKANPLTESVWAALVKSVATESEDAIGRAIADFLGASTSSAYQVHKPLYLARKGNDAEALAAVQGLGRFKGESLVTAQLAASLKDAREPVAMAAAGSLGQLEADAPRIAALSQEGVAPAVRAKVAEDLSQPARTVPGRIAGLSWIAQNQKDSVATQAVASLGKVPGDEARRAVEGFLAAATPELRAAAAQTLVARSETPALQAIVNAARSGKEAQAMEDAGYAIMLAQPLTAILEQTLVKDNLIQRIAYRALGEKPVDEASASKVFETLKAGAASKDPLIRGAAARALGRAATPQALELIKPLFKDKSPEVRRDVALALGAYRNGENLDVLMGYLDDASPEVVSAAIDAMQTRKEADALNRFNAFAAKGHPQVRRSAFKALATFVNRQDAKAQRDLISLLGGAVADPDLQVQMGAMEQLGTFNDEMAVTSIAMQAVAADVRVRAAAVTAMGNTGHKSAFELVIRALDDGDLAVRKAAVRSLGNLKDKSARGIIEKRMSAEKDPEMLELMQATIRSL